MPTILFSVTWEEKEVILGSELTIEDTQETPNVQITPIAPIEGRSPTYTLAMLDPDAPSHEDRKYGPYRHWLVSSIFHYKTAIGISLLPRADNGPSTADSKRDHCCSISAKRSGGGITRPSLFGYIQTNYHSLPAT